MVIVTRVIRKVLALLAPTAASLAASEAPKAAAPPQNTPSISALVKRLSEEPAMRARFGANPRAVLSEAGIDPAPLNVGERLSDTEVERLIGRWRLAEGSIRLAASEGSDGGPAPTETSPAMTAPPAAVYGPSPGLRPAPPPIAAPAAATTVIFGTAMKRSWKRP